MPNEEVKTWRFYRKVPKRALGTVRYERENEWEFEGTKEEAQKELSDRISRTWSPFVSFGFEEV